MNKKIKLKKKKDFCYLFHRRAHNISQRTKVVHHITALLLPLSVRNLVVPPDHRRRVVTHGPEIHVSVKHAVQRPDRVRRVHRHRHIRTVDITTIAMVPALNGQTRGLALRRRIGYQGRRAVEVMSGSDPRAVFEPVVQLKRRGRLKPRRGRRRSRVGPAVYRGGGRAKLRLQRLRHEIGRAAVSDPEAVVDEQSRVAELDGLVGTRAHVDHPRRGREPEAQAGGAVESPDASAGVESPVRRLVVVALERDRNRQRGVEVSVGVHGTHAEVRWVRAPESRRHAGLLVLNAAYSFQVKPVFLKHGKRNKN